MSNNQDNRPLDPTVRTPSVEAVSATDATSVNPDEVPDNPTRNRRRLYLYKIAATGLFTALSFGLYLLGPLCKLPFMFPSFFDLQFSELPALIAGFMLGPVYGAAVIIIKCLLKMAMTSTAFVGEATDMLLGLCLVLPASFIYRLRNNVKGALWGVIVGSVCMVGASVLVNRYISVPFYLAAFFGGNKAALVGPLRPLFPPITWDSFYTYYLCLSVIPFNLLRCVLIGILTFAVYKRLSRLFKRWIGDARPAKAPARAGTSFVAALTRRSVPAMWSTLVLLAALIVAVLVGLYCTLGRA